VAAADVGWFQLDPLRAQSTVKKTKVSKDGLVLTLTKVNGFRTGDWKCVVSKDGKKAEGKFSVSTGIKEGELIAVEEDTFEFYEGAKFVTLKVKIEAGAKITEMTWTCNGKEVVNDDKYTIKQKGAYKVLVIEKPTAADAGSCTATAHGVGEVDSETVNVKEIDVGVILTPTTPVECKENVKGCMLKCAVKITDGSKTNKANAAFYKIGDEDTAIAGVFKKGFFQKDLGPKKTPATAAGEYYCKYTHAGHEYFSDPIIVEVEEQNTEVILTAVSPVQCKENVKGCLIKCTVEIVDGSKNNKKNGGFYKVGADNTKLAGVFKNGFFQRELGAKKTPKTAAGEYYCKYTHKGTTYTSADPIVVDMDEQNTEVTLAPMVSPVACKPGANCIIRCTYSFADGSKFTAANSKFYKKDGDNVGPAIAGVWNNKTMMKSFGKKTTADVAGEYICRYTHKGTEYTSLDTITVNWAAKVKKSKKRG